MVRSRAHGLLLDARLGCGRVRCVALTSERTGKNCRSQRTYYTLFCFDHNATLANLSAGQVLDINAVIYGLIYLFYEPNPEDPLNHEAAELYRENISQFERTVKRTLAGTVLQGETFQRLI